MPNVYYPGMRPRGSSKTACPFDRWDAETQRGLEAWPRPPCGRHRTRILDACFLAMAYLASLEGLSLTQSWTLLSIVTIQDLLAHPREVSPTLKAGSDGERGVLCLLIAS